MKKLFLLISLAVIGINSEAQTIFNSSEVWNYNKAFEIGIQGTQIGRSSDGFSEWGLGFDCTCYGVYLDYSYIIGTHEDDVRVDKWKDKRGWAFHLGYQIPISKEFRIIPQIGYVSGDYGITDGMYWTVTSSGIKNSFESVEGFSSIDYGAKLVLCPAKNFVLFGQATAHTFGVGLGYELTFY